MCQIKCANCGATNNIKLFASQPRNRRRHAFESTAPTGGGWAWLRYIFTGGERPDRTETIPIQYTPDPVTIKVEMQTPDRRQWHLAELDPAITLGHLQAVAQAAMVDGVKWSRHNITRAANISQTTHNLIQNDFKRLQFLTISANNQSALTSPGRRFLRGILQTR